MSRPEPDPQGAAAAYERAVGLNSGNPDDWAALGHIRVASLNDWAGGRSALEEAVRQQPGNGSAWYDLAVARRMLTDKEGAVVAADQASTILKSNDAKLLAAQTRVDRSIGSDLSDAADAAQTIASDSKIDSDKARALSIKGGALLKQGKPADAFDALDAAAAIIKDSPENTLWTGLALMQKGDATAAQDKFASAVELTRNAPPSPLMAKVRLDAEKALKDVAKFTGGERRVITTETARSEQPETEKKPMPPVSEENGTTEPVPAKAPGPR
jgi:tetratricopeptide (TPR) repeat protein